METQSIAGPLGILPSAPTPQNFVLAELAPRGRSSRSGAERRAPMSPHQCPRKRVRVREIAPSKSHRSGSAREVSLEGHDGDRFARFRLACRIAEKRSAREKSTLGLPSEARLANWPGKRKASVHAPQHAVERSAIGNWLARSGRSQVPPITSLRKAQSRHPRRETALRGGPLSEASRGRTGRR